MNYFLIRNCDVANGEGVRVSLFVCGCRHRCKGCFSPQTWDFGAGREFDADAERRLFDAVDREWVAGLTILGGDPLEPENAACLVGVVRRFRERFGKGKTLWVYTGCVVEELYDRSSPYWSRDTVEMLTMVDVLVDGPYVEGMRDPSLDFRGSANQRVIRIGGVSSGCRGWRSRSA